MHLHNVNSFIWISLEHYELKFPKTSSQRLLYRVYNKLHASRNKIAQFFFWNDQHRCQARRKLWERTIFPNKVVPKKFTDKGVPKNVPKNLPNKGIPKKCLPRMISIHSWGRTSASKSAPTKVFQKSFQKSCTNKGVSKKFPKKLHNPIFPREWLAFVREDKY